MEIVRFQFVADFFYFTEFTLFMRCRKYGVFSGFLKQNSTLFTVLPIFSNSFHYYIKISIYLGQVAFASNRLTSAVFVMQYEKVSDLYSFPFFKKRDNFLVLDTPQNMDN